MGPSSARCSPSYYALLGSLAVLVSGPGEASVISTSAAMFSREGTRQQADETQHNRESIPPPFNPVNEYFRANGDARFSSRMTTASTQEREQGDGGGCMIASEVMASEEESDGGDVYASDSQDGGANSEDAYYDTSSFDPQDSEDVSMHDSNDDEGCFDSESAYRDSPHHTARGSAATTTTTASGNQLPDLGRYYTAQPFFNSHMSRRHYQQEASRDRARRKRLNRAQQQLSAVPGKLATGTACAAVGIAVFAPLAQALSSHWPYFVAGGICASVSHTAAVPLDVLKTRIQCAEPGEYRGTWDALVRIWRSEGAQVLFGGAGATLVGYAMQGCLKFGFFEFLKPFFGTLFNGGASGPVLGSLIAASVTAEVVGSSALTPLEAARIRMVSDTSYAPGLRSGIARMISEEGLGALTRGLPAVLAKQIPYTVTKLVTFDVLTRSFGEGHGKGGVGVTVACAVVAGMLSSLASQPGDSLLSMFNSERRDHTEGRSEPVAVAMARIARRAGFLGLFRGTGARMLHVTAIVTLQLMIYQTVKSMVGIGS